MLRAILEQGDAANNPSFAPMPIVVTQLPGAGGYRVRHYPAWENFPSGDLLADTRRVNAFIEAQVRAEPGQWFWQHRRWPKEAWREAGVL